MVARSPLIQIAKLIATDMADGAVSDGMRQIGEALAAHPESVLEVLDLLAREASKKKPNRALLDALVFMLGQALETLRYGLERNYPEAQAAVESARAKVCALVEAGKLPLPAALLTLHQFAVAKLDLGEMRDRIERAFQQDDLPDVADPEEFILALTEMIKAHGGDVFAFQAAMTEQIATFPDSDRALIAAALLAAPDPLLHEAAVGWLLDSGPETRKNTATLLLQAATTGTVSPTMLRRMIAIRNWLPEADRSAVDAVIRACRKKGIECAPMPVAEVREVVATGIDGSGAQSLFLVVKDGRKQAVAALLLKNGIGVRDAWVNPGLSKADTKTFLYQVDSQTDSYDSAIDHVKLTLGNALAVGRESGHLPPFGLVDVVERAGLGALPPELVPVEELIEGLLAEVPAVGQTKDVINRTIETCGLWEADYESLQSWFEDNGAIDVLLGTKKLSRKRRVTLVLENYISDRRRYWAELLAWMAVTLQHDESTEGEWLGLALVAREILDSRPLASIPLMVSIAEKSVTAWQERNRL